MTLAELNIIFRAKGLDGVKAGVNDLNTSIKRTSNASAESRKSIQLFDRSLRDISSTLRGVEQLSKLVSVTLGAPLIAAAFQASKTNVELANSFRDIRNASTDFTNSIGQSLVPIVNDISDAIRKAVDQWVALPKSQRDSIVTTAAWTAASALAITTATKFLRTLINLYLAFRRLGMTGIGAALIGLGKFGALIGGITLAVTKLENALGKVGAFAKVAKQNMTLGNLVNLATNPASGAAQLAMQAGMSFGQKQASGALGAVDLGAIHVGGKQASESLSGVAKSLQDIQREINKTFGEMAVQLPTLAQTIATQLKTVFDSLSQGIGQAVAQSIVYGENFKDTFINVLKSIAAQVIQSLTEIAVKKAALGFLGGGFGGLLGGFGSFLGGLTPFAEGGIVTKPTPALIGEAGPEAVIPLDQMDSMGGNVTIHLNGHTFLNDEGMVDILVRRLSEATKRATTRRTGGTSIAL